MRQWITLVENVVERELNEIIEIPDFDDELNKSRLARTDYSMEMSGAKKVADLNGVDLYEYVFGQLGGYMYLFVDKGQIIGKALVAPRAENEFKVQHVWINPQYRGKNIGYAFYQYLIDRGIRLFADYDQTRFSKALWSKLAKNGYVYDRDDDHKVTDVSDYYTRNPENYLPRHIVAHK